MSNFQILKANRVEWVCGAVSAVKDFDGQTRLLVMSEPKELIQKIDEMMFELFVSAVLSSKGCSN